MMQDDPIVKEVRRIKEEHAARYGYDVRALCKALRQEQRRGGRKVVSLVEEKQPANS